MECLSPLEAFRAAAEGYKLASELLFSSLRERNVPINHPAYLAAQNQLGLAVELSLKFYILARKGLDQEALARKPYGHNLIELLSAAVDAGLIEDVERFDVPDFSERLGTLVSNLAGNYGDHSYRYFSAESFSVAHSEKLVNEAIFIINFILIQE